MTDRQLSKLLKDNHVNPVNFIFKVKNNEDKEVQLCFYFYYKDSEKTYYFVYEDNKKAVAEVTINNDTNDVEIIMTDASMENLTVSEDTIKSCAKDMYENRDDNTYYIGDIVEIGTTKSQYMYMDLLEQCLILRCVRDGKDISNGYKQFINARTWLESGDFFSAPASTKYHDANYQGLLNHTLKVYDCMLALYPTFYNLIDIASATLCCLVHDWCKIGTYEGYKKNVKDVATGDWVQEDAYKRVPSKFPFGHGETSMYIANKMFNLKLDEALAIRWHMGEYYTPDALTPDLEESCDRYPLVNLLQFADKLAITEYCTY